MQVFTTVRKPDTIKLKKQYEHTKDKRFYKQIGDGYPIHVILGDSTYCRIRIEEVYKGQPGEPIVEGRNDLWLGNPWWKRLKQPELLQQRYK